MVYGLQKTDKTAKHSESVNVKQIATMTTTLQNRIHGGNHPASRIETAHCWRAHNGFAGLLGAHAAHSGAKNC